MSKRARRTRPPKASLGIAPSDWAAVGVCLFVLGFAAPIPSQLPLLALVGGALLGAFLDKSPRQGALPRPFMAATVLFLVLMALSIFFSDDRARSLELSAAWVPAGLLFVVLSERLRSPAHIRAVYASFSFVALCLAGVLLAGRWFYGANPHAWLSTLGLPVLVVPNDCHFLALLTPLSLILIDRQPRTALGLMALVSIGLTGFAILALGSRGAALTLVVCLVGTGTLLRPRLGLGLGLGAFGIIAVGDAALGFPLASKFTHVVDTRISLWIIAWEMFLDPPWMGHGPHTYRTLYTAYFEAIVFPSWVRPDPWGTEVPWAHNLYLELLAERGIIGFFSFTGMVGMGAFYALRVRQEGSGELSALASGTIGVLAGLGLSGVFEASLLRIWLVVLLLVVLGIIAQLAVLMGAESVEAKTASGGSTLTKAAQKRVRAP